MTFTESTERIRTAESIRRADPIRRAGLVWVKATKLLSGGSLYVCHNGKTDNILVGGSVVSKGCDYTIHYYPGKPGVRGVWFWRYSGGDPNERPHPVKLLRDAKTACAQHFLALAQPEPAPVAPVAPVLTFLVTKTGMSVVWTWVVAAVDADDACRVAGVDRRGWAVSVAEIPGCAVRPDYRDILASSEAEV